MSEVSFYILNDLRVQEKWPQRTPILKHFVGGCFPRTPQWAHGYDAHYSLQPQSQRNLPSKRFSLYFQFFPKWLAPNILTFSGWCLLFMIYAVTCYYDPHFTASSESDKTKRIPSVWWLVFAVAHFAAHTFDGCDGKQARRTNSRY